MEERNQNELVRRMKIIANLLKNRKFKTAIHGTIYNILNILNIKFDELKYRIKKINKDNIEVINLEDGNKIYINLNDDGISKELYLQRKREIYSTEFLKKFIDENEIIIEIGANIGHYTIIESSVLKEGKIYAIEPIPKNMELLKKNVILNNIKNIKLFPIAIGEENNSSKMYFYKKSNLSGFKSIVGEDLLEEVEVDIINLDTFIESYMEEYPTFIRMDVEGYEYNLFKGATKLLESGKPLKIKMEIHPNNMTKQQLKYILNSLKYYKFEIKAIVLDPYNHNIKNIKFINYLRENIGLFKFGIVPIISYEDLYNILPSFSFVGIDKTIIFLERN